MNNHQNATYLNYLSTSVFILIFAVLMWMVKRHVARFLSFFVLRRDYRRMRCVQQINESHLKNEPLTPSQLGSEGDLRSMTKQEVVSDYKRTIMMNMRRYHPLLWISHRRFSNLNSSRRVPKNISCTLMGSWIIITITMTLALY